MIDQDKLDDLDEHHDELRDFYMPKKEENSRTTREMRIIAGFEDIEHFVEQEGHLPTHGEDRDIFERLYAMRLDTIRASQEARTVLERFDRHGLLEGSPVIMGDGIATNGMEGEFDDDVVLAQLADIGNSDITKLTHVRPRAERRAAEEIANRTPCHDFKQFKPLFDALADDLTKGIRQSRKIRKEAGFLETHIKVGDFFILYGQVLYIAEIGKEIKGSNEAMDARLRVIYANGTQSNILRDSLRRGLYKDESSRIISKPDAGPLFAGEFASGDIKTGTLYILRSRSNHPFIKQHRELIHKIGITTGDVKKRLGNPQVSSTYLMADVDIVATYNLVHINPIKFEKNIHRFFKTAQLNIEIKDRLGKLIDPREWFLVPLPVIEEAIDSIKDGSIINCVYDAQTQVIKRGPK